MQALMDDGSGGFISPIDEAEIRTEAMAVGLVAADRLASLLLYNAEVGPRPGLKVSMLLAQGMHRKKHQALERIKYVYLEKLEQAG